MRSFIEAMFDVENRIAIITGGLGQLGRQYANTLLAAGASVAIFDTKEGEAPSICTKSCIKKAKVYKVDITSLESVKRGVELVVEECSFVKGYGYPSILVNNAAIDAPPGSALGNCTFEDYPEEALDKTWAVNVKGMVFCSQVVGGIMAKKQGGSIINISSIYGNVSPDQRIYEHLEKDGKPFYKPVSYSITKSAVLNLTRYLATYPPWAKKNVRINTLSLGGVYNNQDPRFINNYTGKVPLGRMARENEYNAALLFLASDASSYMTGSNVVIDGGFTSW